jgi:hypothetical protein
MSSNLLNCDAKIKACNYHETKTNNTDSYINIPYISRAFITCNTEIISAALSAVTTVKICIATCILCEYKFKTKNKKEFYNRKHF